MSKLTFCLFRLLKRGRPRSPGNAYGSGVDLFMTNRFGPLYLITAPDLNLHFHRVRLRSRFGFVLDSKNWELFQCYKRCHFAIKVILLSIFSRFLHRQHFPLLTHSLHHVQRLRDPRLSRGV